MFLIDWAYFLLLKRLLWCSIKYKPSRSKFVVLTVVMLVAGNAMRKAKPLDKLISSCVLFMTVLSALLWNSSKVYASYVFDQVPCFLVIKWTNDFIYLSCEARLTSSPKIHVQYVIHRCFYIVTEIQVRPVVILFASQLKEKIFPPNLWKFVLFVTSKKHTNTCLLSPFVLPNMISAQTGWSPVNMKPLAVHGRAHFMKWVSMRRNVQPHLREGLRS